MRGSPVVLKQFTGLNLADDPAELPLSSAVALANVEPNGRGGLHRREALVEKDSTAGLENLYKGLGVDVYASTATTWRALGGAAFSTGLTPTAKVGCVGPKTAAGTALAFFMTDKVNTPKFWDGSVLTNWVATTGTVPLATKMVFAGGRFIVGDAVGDAVGQVRASTPGDAYNWGTGAGQGWSVILPTGDPVNALVAIGPYVLVFGSQTISLIYDLDTGANRVLSVDHGVLSYSASNRFVTSDGHVAYFINLDQQVYSTDGNGLRLLSGALGWLGVVPHTLDATGALSGASVGCTQIAAFQGRYVLAASRAGYLYVFDLVDNSWWVHTTAASGGFGAMLDNPFKNDVTWPSTVCLADRACAWQPHHSLYTPTAATDGTTAPVTFTSLWTGGFSDFGQIGRKKRVRAVNGSGVVAAGALSVALNHDALTGTPRALALGNTVPTYASLNSGWGVGRLWQPVLTDSSSSRWRLDELEIDWQPRKG